MSTAASETRRLSVPDIRACKGKRKIVSLTAHNRSLAEIVDEFVDVILMGDSTAMVAYGQPNTLHFSLDQTIQHSRAVVQATRRACVVADLPFASYQESPVQAFRSAARLMQEANVAAVKLEGSAAMAPTVQFLVERGIPVMAHIGLMPQFVNTMGGFRAQGMDDSSANAIREAATAMEQAGAFCFVLEGLAEPLARELTETLSVPTIGIGASPACDGQVLVIEDILGLGGDFVPRFAKRYADVHAVIRDAVGQFSAEVRDGSFPELSHCFGVKR
ncbi:3-methyl-2-oxobutanoate hydroxymethyltransferase [Pseudomonas sp. PB103]|jgi:3-methyl-2-oxobutanoate hydroxymethyltransferase|uniref:3-methyl-2-oxobutanoate hydroxymethyltransferase n=1 Tax=Pseudomonas sp. PB103 TaxID=2494698 RepID=UPI00131DD335|nr:3-methyl-2-oxobutanoate hydroxymethyltransferase [Pseudomonas sp. PB103]KAE9644231.1 3-methyl-2-oxobutanoate hydroxymethyltransferase [Pseudomonas sp. PB103]